MKFYEGVRGGKETPDYIFVVILIFSDEKWPKNVFKSGNLGVYFGFSEFWLRTIIKVITHW